MLCEGGVPQRPVVFVTRKKLVNAIQQKLWKLNGDPGWVTIYGMAGCGKSVLAAEAVRDHSLLEGKFDQLLVLLGIPVTGGNKLSQINIHFLS